MNTLRRARPLLGTLVEMRVEGLAEKLALDAIDAAFAEVATVHRLMSFHAQDSDLARLHGQRAGTPVRVDARTREVILCALRVCAASRGCFDPTIAAEQVAWGLLPRPHSAFAPDPQANWQDIIVLDDAVCLRKPAWLDLGGIAKGYAVDRALEMLLAAGATQVCVNAGGDLRIAGPRAERVHLRGGGKLQAPIGSVDIANAAVATSAGFAARRRASGHWRSAHVHGRERRPVGTSSSASVVAERCMIADALTKVVLALGEASQEVLAEFGAHACTHNAWRGWHHVSDAA